MLFLAVFASWSLPCCTSRSDGDRSGGSGGKEGISSRHRSMASDALLVATDETRSLISDLDTNPLRLQFLTPINPLEYNRDWTFGMSLCERWRASISRTPGVLVVQAMSS